MGLDIYLISKTPVTKKGTGVFVRENGKNKELSVEEALLRYPDSFVDQVEYETNTVFSINITHNLTEMADEAGIYEAVWRPYRLVSGFNIQEGNHYAEAEFESSVTILSSHISKVIEAGLNDMKRRPDHYKKFDSDNGWGTYSDFVPFLEEYLKALKQYPDAVVNISR